VRLSLELRVCHRLPFRFVSARDASGKSDYQAMGCW
jgi:hypothetical protein